MPHPQVTKGRLTTVKSGDSRQFMFNPNKIKDDQGVNYGVLTPAGGTPIYQFGSGGERIITFKLFFDGDRGRIGVGRALGEPLDVSDELNFYRSLLIADAYDRTDISRVFPQQVLFTLGSYVTALLCIVVKAGVTVNFWTPKMAPVRATVDIVLKEVLNRNRVASDVRGPSLIGGSRGIL